jgi:hypothetical protein
MNFKHFKQKGKWGSSNGSGSNKKNLSSVFVIDNYSDSTRFLTQNNIQSWSIHGHFGKVKTSTIFFFSTIQNFE